MTALVLARFPRYWLLAWAGAIFEIPAWVLIGMVLAIFVTYAIRGIPELWARIKERRARKGEVYRVSGPEE